MFTTLNAPEVQEAAHRYPGITFISQALNANKSRRILDLGSASAASFNFFMRKGCTVRFENISQYVADQLTNAEVRASQLLRASLEDYLSGFRSHEKFDVVLTWDLFNFLDLETLSWLVSKLGEFCHDQSLLHSVRYLKAAPAAPLQYQIVSDHEVKYQGLVDTAPNYEAHLLPELVRSLPFYHLDTSFNQQNGMPKDVSEDVYRFQPSKRNMIRHQAKLDTPEVSTDSLPGKPHRSYALEALCDHLTTIESPRILDFGAAIDTNEEFYRNYSNNISFAGLYEALKNNITPQEILTRKDLFKCEPDDCFDVVFAWGLLGYCSKEQLLAIKQRLLPHMHADTKIHVVIYAGYTQPVTPDRYYIKNIRTLFLPEVKEYSNGQPPVTAIRLLKILGDASYENSFIMKPGMAPNFFEHILVLQKSTVHTNSTATL